jgi:hypothetical protein
MSRRLRWRTMAPHAEDPDQERSIMSRITASLAVSAAALVLAFAGTSHAMSRIAGATIAKRSIPGNRIKTDALSGHEIRESTLAKVPAAAHADSATSAHHAVTAAQADHAAAAGQADHAASASQADHAATADHATSADAAVNAQKLGGIAADGYVQGDATIVDTSNYRPAGSALSKWADVTGLGSVHIGCAANSQPILQYVNDTGQVADATVFGYGSGLAPALLGGPWGAGAQTTLQETALVFELRAAPVVGEGAADLTVSATGVGGSCRFSLSGVTSPEMPISLPPAT